MSGQFRALVWKEWREGWLVAALVWAAVGLLALKVASDIAWVLPGAAAVCLGAAILGGRPFAGEAETGTLRFLMSQPVSPEKVWRAKLLVGALSLAVLYGLAFGLVLGIRPSARFVDIELGPFRPAVVLLPLVSFAVAFLLSALVDNSVLACLGGFIAGTGHVMPIAIIGLAFEAYGSGSRTDAAAEAVVGFVCLLGSTALCLALSRWVFRRRVRQ